LTQEPAPGGPAGSRTQLRGANDRAVTIEGLWSIAFGNEAAADPNKLYFTAGSNGEADGLFGSLSAVPRLDANSAGK
jgi:hypothetical protein